MRDDRQLSPVRPAHGAGLSVRERPLLWSPKEKKRTLIKGREDVSLLNGYRPEAWICRDCHKVVVHYR